MVSEGPKPVVLMILIVLILAAAGCGTALQPPGKDQPPPAAPEAGTVSVQTTDWGYRVGPFVHNGGFRDTDYSWLAKNLGLYRDEHLAWLVVPSDGRSYSFDSIHRYSAIAVSQDNSRIAYAWKGYLAVEDLNGGGMRRWAMTAAPDSDDELKMEQLFWSPGGRYLLGVRWHFPEYSFAAGKLWALDWETGELISLSDETHPFCRPTWSPDGRRVVLLEHLEAYTCGYFAQWVLVDLPSAETRVIVPAGAERIDYHFAWDDAGNVRAEPVLPGPGGTRAVGYDPVREAYGNWVDHVITELHFLTVEGKQHFRADLMPALAETGLPLSGIETLNQYLSWSPDGTHLYLEGHAVSTGYSASCMLHGSVDADTGTVRFLPVEKGWEGRRLPVLTDGNRWSGNKILLANGEGVRELRVLDIGTMKVATLATGQDFLAACWAGPDVLYVTPREVGLIRPGGGARLLTTAPEEETYVAAALFSPCGGYLAVPREKPGEGQVRWVTLDVVDLERLRPH